MAAVNDVSAVVYSVKRKRGRPPKNAIPALASAASDSAAATDDKEKDEDYQPSQSSSPSHESNNSDDVRTVIHINS